jgi:hypothetical protein
MSLLQRDDENQTRCWIASGGHVWMRGYFDKLPLPVRQRLRDSSFNLCPACLLTKFLPKVSRRGQSRQQALFAAIEVMEDLLEVDFQRREARRDR